MYYCKKCGILSRNIFILNRKYVYEGDRYRKRSFHHLDRKDEDGLYVKLDCNCLLSFRDYINVEYRFFITEWDKLSEDRKNILDRYYGVVDVVLYSDIRKKMLNMRRDIKALDILRRMGE